MPQPSGRHAILCLALVTSIPIVAALDSRTPSAGFYEAIRTSNLTALRGLVSDRARVNVKDRQGATPLMYAAAVGSVEAMKALLAAGADPKAANKFGATPLLWSAGNLAKVRLLVDAGADLNARSKEGMTPLLLAASTAGSSEILRLLVSKGADLTAASEGGMNALLAAASANDFEMARFFVERGIKINAADKFGNTALHFAAGGGNLALVKLLLAKGANVNAVLTDPPQVRKGPIALSRISPLMFAAPYGPPELIRTLIDAGANVNARDIRQMSPLMLAVSSETQNPDVVQLLLQKGADVNTKSTLDETALDWAKKFGNPAVIRLLQESGGKAAATGATVPGGTAHTASEVTAVQLSVALLQRSGAEFFRESGCVGCHHQNFTALAVGAARTAGVPVDETAAEEQLKTVKMRWMGLQESLLQRLDPPGGSDTVGYSLMGLAAAGYTPDAITDAMIVNLAGEQTPDGSWCTGGTSRAPIEEGCIARAALGIRAMQLYGPAGLASEFNRRIARARDYLLSAKPKTTDDRAMLVVGLKAARTSQEKLEANVQALLGEQRADGGWAGNPYLTSDAYSTGEALCALHDAGALDDYNGAYRRGGAFLLGTQRPDGSWYVKSRAVKFQPYFQSGFPYEHDQWISASATALAAVALSYEIKEAPSSTKRAAAR